MRKKILLLAGLIFLLGVGVFAASRIKIKKIICRSQYGPCSAEVEAGLAGAKTWQWDKFLKTRPEIADFRISLVSFDRVLVEVVEEKALAAVKKDGFENFILVGEGGKVLGERRETNLPVVRAMGEIDLGFVAEVGWRVYSLYGTREIEASPVGIKAVVEGGRTAWFPASGDVEVLFGALNLIISRLNAGLVENRIDLIDLRYKNPVIK